ncbi:MAG: energy-coupling factor transporter transmembrane protein EcfT [Cellulosilyticum sp.]|nr:energy-coupling factor transporter transmembrane protein EcfT [Cellulosilyticum sp.]
MSTMLGYIKAESPIHHLTGATKLICLLLYSVAVMLTYDTRVLLGLLIFGLACFKASKIPFKDVAFVVYFILAFLMLNNIAIFIFSPYEGCAIYGQKTVLFHLIGPYSVTLEQLFYMLNVTLKYFAVIPIALLFILATHPSEFAASLNRIGVSYRLSYSVAIALRYIPDIQRDYQEISFAQQARGLDLSKNEKPLKRIKNMSSILLPLVFTSLERIETISRAMELRSFGMEKKRTWYSAKSFKMQDYLAIGFMLLLVVLSLCVMKINGGRFYNPFI